VYAQLTAVLKEASVLFKENLNSLVVMRRKIVKRAPACGVVDALASYALPVFKTAVTQPVAFAEAAATGLTELETDPNSAAVREIRRLGHALVEGYVRSPRSLPFLRNSAQTGESLSKSRQGRRSRRSK
jgi:chromosome partitioning protein